MGKKADRQRVGVLERREKALELRIQGYSFRDIGLKLGISHVSAYRHVQSAIANWAKRVDRNVEELREIERRKYDRLELKLRPSIEKGDPGAIRTAIHIARRRAALEGLDMPTKLHVAGEGGGPIELRTWADVVKAATQDKESE